MVIQLINERLTQIAKEILPHRFRKQLRIARLRLRYAFLGSTPKQVYTCPVLNQQVKGFIRKSNQLITHSNEALSRHRMLMHYLRENNLLNQTQKSLLHIAPEECLAQVFERQPTIDYIGLDKFSKGYSYLDRVQQGDITDLPFDAKRFDLIICNHVLEHIIDDRKAMQELSRVLKNTGTCFITVPINPSLPATDEDETVLSPFDRKQRFGQWDHVRYYGLDIKDRLLNSGFKEVLLLNYKEEIGPELASQFGIQNDFLILCKN